MKNLVFVPTYWTFEKDKRDNVFDHPALISKKGWLGRMLRSFQEHKLKYRIFILPVPVHRNVEITVRHITKKFPGLDIDVLDAKGFNRIMRKVGRTGCTKEFRREINLQDYPGIRNLGLIYAATNGYDNIIMLDDDEVIEDRHFFKKAVEGIGSKIRGRPLLGKTGYYIQKSGTYKLKQANPWLRPLWLKETYINQAVESSISKKSRFTRTSIALGGNMVINRGLFMKVPFDPFNTRGEDIDYLMNAKHFNNLFLMDRELTVRHLPPRVSTHYWRKLRRDIYRFVYTREKLKHMRLRARDMEPYPGIFLKKDLVYRIMKTNISYVSYCINKGWISDAREYLRNTNDVLSDAQKYAKKNSQRYFGFQKEWPGFAKEL